MNFLKSVGAFFFALGLALLLAIENIVETVIWLIRIAAWTALLGGVAYLVGWFIVQVLPL